MRYDDRMINDDAIENNDAIDAIESSPARLTAAEIAAHMRIDAKSLRSFIRRHALMPDHAHRAAYDFSIDDARRIIAAHAARKSIAAKSNRSPDAIAALLAD